MSIFDFIKVKKNTKKAREELLNQMESTDGKVLATIITDYFNLLELKAAYSALFKVALIIFGAVLWFVTMYAISHLIFPSDTMEHKAPHIGVVSVSGAIAEGGSADASKIITGLQAAMKDPASVGVIIQANSPGGSPVQSGYVYDEIMDLKAKYPEKPIYFMISDMCASGCYYMAAAATEIYADKASIVGSIGVRMDGFGFTGVMEKLGVERRLLTAGKSKGMLDPFSPINDDHVAHAKQMMGVIHNQFINAVKVGRGERLGNDPELFTGKFWSGEQALEMGLVDGLSRSSKLAMTKFGIDNFVSYTVKESKLNALAKKFGAEALADNIVSSLIGKETVSIK